MTPSEQSLSRGRQVPTREEFTIVWELMRHPAADGLVPLVAEEGRADPDVLSRILPAILADLCEEMSSLRKRGVKGVLVAITEWAEASAPFRLGLLWEWRSLDEVAV